MSDPKQGLVERLDKWLGQLPTLLDSGVPLDGHSLIALLHHCKAELERLHQAEATLKDPKLWMKWCDNRVLERCEALQEQLAQAQRDAQRLFHDIEMALWAVPITETDPAHQATRDKTRRLLIERVRGFAAMKEVKP